MPKPNQTCHNIRNVKFKRICGLQKQCKHLFWRLSWFYSTSANKGHSAVPSFAGMNGTPHRALFSFRAAQRGSLNKLSLFSNYFSWLSLFCSPLKICPDTVCILSFSLNHSPQYCQCQMAEVPQRAPKATAQQKLLSAPSPLTRNKLEPWILPHQGRTQRNPPTSPPSITSLLFQAVATCKAFPQAEHMDLINCRSLTTLSCSNQP